MNTSLLIFAIATGVVAIVVIWAIWQLEKRVGRRFAARFVANAVATAATPVGRPKLKPESDYIVDVSETCVTCTRPNGDTESVMWNELQRVEILTTEDGPFAPDIFWVLYGSTGGCVIPWGATGEKQLMDRLQALPEFRNDAIVNAASLTTNNLLLCWERKHQNA